MTTTNVQAKLTNVNFFPFCAETIMCWTQNYSLPESLALPQKLAGKLAAEFMGLPGWAK